jgi:hypothetical protein
MDPTIEIEGAAEMQHRRFLTRLPIATGLALALAFATTNAQTKPNVDCVSTQKVDAATSCER